MKDQQKPKNQEEKHQRTNNNELKTNKKPDKPLNEYNVDKLSSTTTNTAIYISTLPTKNSTNKKTFQKTSSCVLFSIFSHFVLTLSFFLFFFGKFFNFWYFFLIFHLEIHVQFLSLSLCPRLIKSIFCCGLK